MRDARGALSARAASGLLAGLTAFGLLCLFDPASPPPAALDAPAAEFSAARATVLLEQIARAPHPTGSSEQARVRAFLSMQLDALGVEWERQPWVASAGNARAQGEIEGVNLVVRLPAAGGALDAARVLCVVHYDSHPAAPGAGDDGAAVVAVLESLRVLVSEGPRRNELLFLLSDGEELGLLGAEAFAADPERLQRVAVVLDFEARGNAGPTILFETGRDDRAWIEAYARCATRPLAASLGPSIYERMPNDTDFTVFKRLGLPGLNFAFIGGGTAYHRPADRPENLDPRALQHHGETLLALARELGDADLDALSAASGRATFFTLPGNLFVHYGAGWDAPLWLLAALCVFGSLAAQLRSGRMRWPQLILGSLAAPCLLALSAAAIAGLGVGLRSGVLAFAPQGESTGNGESSIWILTGLAALAASVGALLARLLGERGRDALGAGSLLLCLALAGAALLLLPGASYVLAWPVLLCAAALPAVARLQADSPGRAASHLVLWGGVLGVLALGLPTLRLLHQVGAVSPVAGVFVAAVVLALGLGPLLPALGLLGAALPRPIAAAWSLLGPALLAVGAWLEAAGR